MLRFMRGSALVATAALTLTTLTGAPAQAAVTDDRPVDAGADWITDELTGGLLHNAAYDFDDYGLSIDTALALDAVGGHDDTVQTISQAVAKGIGAYTGTPDVYAGSVAKALVLAQVAKADAGSFGGVDLVSTLESRVSTTAPVVGRISDKSSFGDFANTIGQSFAVRGLTNARSPRAAAATDFLLQQQCPAGYFRLYFNADPRAAAQSCTAGAPGSEADTDATSLAVLNLLAARGPESKAVKDALQRAGDWLADQQRGNGAFGGGTATTAPNANSTGLAGWALGELRHDEAARKAAVWVRKLQPVDIGTCRTALKRDLGAIAYDRAALADGREDGITDEAADQWRRATVQALPGLAHAPQARDDLSIAAPARALRSGAKVKLKVRGLAKGESACVWVKRGGFARVVGKGRTTKVKVVLPTLEGARVQTVPAKVRTINGRATTRVTVRKR